MIQEEHSIFWEVTESVIVKISSYKHATDSDWLLRHSCLNVACTVCPSFLFDVLRFLFVQLDEEQRTQMKGGDNKTNSLLAIWMLLPE